MDKYRAVFWQQMLSKVSIYALIYGIYFDK
jgi:hypothetical protein